MLREWMNRQKPAALVFQLALILGSLGFLSLMAVYAFQGSLTRYMADDYCNAVLFSNDAIGGLVLRYMQGWGGNRYSNIWLVGISEIFFSKHVGVLPVSFLMLWAIGLVWMMTESRKLLNQNWSFAMSAFMGLSIAFFSLLQVTNLYQTIYWRSSMTTHFAPIVCGTFLVAYLIRGARNARTSELGKRANGIALASTFLLGGFSEPTDAVQITVLTLALGAVWFWGEKPARERIIKLLAWALAGALLSLFVLLVSPANSRRLGEPPGFEQFAADTFLYTYAFIQGTLKQLPLPSLLSVIFPALALALQKMITNLEFSSRQKLIFRYIVIASPFLAYLLMMASFSPTVYGQGFPVERTRFYARLIMTVWLLLEGSVFGLLLPKVDLRLNKDLGPALLAAAFAALAFVYPFRASLNAYQNLPVYRARAELWDLRDAYFIRHASAGELDIVAPGFSGVDGVKELDDSERHWVNKCAAAYYGVNTIRVLSIPDEFLQEVLREN